MNVGELERRSGVGRYTMRYYEQLGLILALRQANTTVSTASRPLLILPLYKVPQSGGFSLAEIGDILAAKRGNTINCAKGAASVVSKMAEV